MSKAPVKEHIKTSNKSQNVYSLYKNIIEHDTQFIETLLIERNKWDQRKTTEVKTEYAKYLAICCYHRKERFAPSKHVDEFWHQHILCTGEYYKFCNHVHGEYIHHKPNLKSQNKQSQQTNKYGAFIKLYTLYFGPLNLDVWPMPSEKVPRSRSRKIVTTIKQEYCDIDGCGHHEEDTDDVDNYQEPDGCENDDGDPCGWPDKCEGPQGCS